MKLNTIDLAELEELITQSEALASKAVRKTMKRIAYDVQSGVQMVAAGPAESPAGPPGSPPFGVLQGIYAYWSEMLSELFSPFLVKSWNAGVNSAIKSIHTETPEWEPPQADQLAIQQLAAAENHINGLSTELWQHAQAEIIAGVEAGDSMHQMAQRMSTVADLSIPRAQTVVRTEVISAANAGTFDLIELAGFSGKQEWLATNDPKTRLTHKKADGQKVDIGATFDVGMWQAHYPGDKTLPPGERYNCRCTVAYDVDEDDLVAALTAAGKWDAGKHPRDGKGKFVKKNLIGILKHDASDDEINEAIDNLSINEWLDLTPEQQKTIEDEVKLSGGFLAKNAIDVFKSLTPKPKVMTSPVGAVKKITHKDIHAPKKAGETFAVNTDGTKSIVWSAGAKKYQVVNDGNPGQLIGKSKLYDFMQGDTWFEPKAAKSKVDEPDTDFNPSMLEPGAPAPSRPVTADDEAAHFKAKFKAAHKAAVEKKVAGLKSTGPLAKKMAGKKAGKKAAKSVQLIYDPPKSDILAVAPNGDKIIKTSSGLKKVDANGEYLANIHKDNFNAVVESNWTLTPHADPYLVTNDPVALMDGPGSAPGEPDWETLGQDVDLGTYPPSTVIAHNDNGDYLEVQADGEIGLYDADGQFIDATSAAEMEVLTLSTPGWKETDEAGKELDFSPKKITSPSPSSPPDPDAPPGTTQIWKQSEAVGGDTALTAYVTGDGKVFFKNNLGEVTSTNWKTESLEVEAFGFTKTWDTTSPTSPTANAGPLSYPLPGSKVQGVEIPPIPKTVGGSGEVVESLFISADPNDKYLLLKTDGGFWTQSADKLTWVKISWQSTWSGDVKKLGDAPVDVPDVVPEPPVHGKELPANVKITAKDTLKQGNLGYWSKPDKIWPVIKQLQALYPSDDNPGHSKYTPLQILQALDSTLKTSKPSPYEEKIKKWLNTPAGKKHAGEMTAPPPTSVTKKATPAKKINGLDAEVAKKLGVSDISDVKMHDEIYKDFKAIGQTFLTSPDGNVYGSMKSIATEHSLSVLQVARIIDVVGAKKVGAENQFLFEKKLTKWAKTPEGVTAITGKAPPAPPGPALKFGNPVLPKAQTDHYKYKVVPHSGHPATPSAKGVKLQAAAEAKWGKVTPTEKASIKYFTSGAYTAINYYLRGQNAGTPSSVMLEHIKHIQAGMRPSTEPMLLHRGVGWSALGVHSFAEAKKLEGKKGVHKGFSSTSVGGNAAFSGPVLLEIEAPPGTPMAYAHPYSHHKTEREMLLAAGLEFEILEIKKNPNSYDGVIARVRIIPS